MTEEEKICPFMSGKTMEWNVEEKTYRPRHIACLREKCSAWMKSSDPWKQSDAHHGYCKLIYRDEK